MAEQMSMTATSLEKLMGSGYPHRFWILGGKPGVLSGYKCVPISSVLVDKNTQGLACYRSETQALEERGDSGLHPEFVDLDRARDIARGLINQGVVALVLVQTDRQNADIHWIA